ncbi:hypothetical protein CPLU01_02051 [Colletotrichum plurivorum]|uniref:Uncharacterized protein n=1 Tax=Colletotrichum plurivorum TaxID=2175906 RepID=A0A8H6KWL8_9PEZI|nr:hypothetical protein CPLU01_02051 [Colletotrichum plurivorum]
MASEDNENNKDNVRRVLWPSARPVAKVVSGGETGGEAATPSRKQDTASLSFSSTRVDVENDLGSRNTGRRMLQPVSILGRNGIRNEGEVFGSGYPGNRFTAIGSTTNSLDISHEPMALDGSDNTSTPKASGIQYGGEMPRTSKALRLHAPDGTRSTSDDNASSPGAARSLDFDPSPKYYLALGTKGNKSANAARDYPEHNAVTPPKPGHESDEFEAAPSRPHSVKTAQSVASEASEQYYSPDFAGGDQSPSIRPLRRRMESLNVRACSFEYPSTRPMGPRPFLAGETPQTPIKQAGKSKRVREEFGQDVAREREILSQYAATRKGSDHEDDEDEEDTEDEDTPKASILNRHLQQ